MEWRHTLEILTKDIQDIEKLVANLQNSATGPSIDLDLALSKMRNVYEVLNMIKEDHMAEKRAMYSATQPPTPEPAARQEPVNPPEPVVPEETVRTPEAAAPEEPAPTAKSETQEAAPEEPAPTAKSETQEAAPEEPAPPAKSETQEAAPEEPAPPAMDEPGHTPETKAQSAGKGILAEKFSAASSINDNLAGQRSAGTETKLAAKPIDNIHRNIGINDRFLIIRELFKGDADSFRDLITELDEAGDLQNARTLLHQRFPDSVEHEGLDILEGLIKRRFTPV